MKNISIILLVLALLSCENEMEELIVSENEILSITAVKDYLPSSYFNQPNLIYINELGEEWKLSTNLNESITDRIHNQISYKTEQFRITLFDPENNFFQIVLVGSTNLSNSGNTILTLSGTLMPFNPTGSTWATIRFENEQPIVSLGDNFKEEYWANGRQYKNTYINIGRNNEQDQHSAYSELNINSEQGVVAFRDENNDLWVFDRIEE